MAITVTPWSAANAKFTQNLSSGVSAAAGYMGSDLASSIDLGGSRVLWMMGDTYWATAAGQSRSQCAFLRNCVALQSGSYDLSASTLTFYAGIAPDGSGSNPGSFFPETAPCNWAWPSTGCLIDDKLLVIIVDTQPSTNALGFDTEGWRAVLVDNSSAAPSSWTMIPVPAPSTNMGPVMTIQLFDAGDGFLYLYGVAKDSSMQTLRWVRSEAKAGRLLNPQWWCGSVYGWSNLPPYSTKRVVPRGVLSGPVATEGNLYKKSGGTYVTIQTPGFGGTSLSYSTSSALSGPFSAFTSFYTPPESTALNGSGQRKYDVYAGKGHYEQTWSGKATDDIVCSYVANAASGGGVSVLTDTTIYFPKIVQVTGI